MQFQNYDVHPLKSTLLSSYFTLPKQIYLYPKMNRHTNTSILSPSLQTHVTSASLPVTKLLNLQRYLWGKGSFPRLSQLICSFLHNPHEAERAPLVAHFIKNLPAMQSTRVQFLGQENLLEKEMAMHSSILAWKLLWTKEPDRVQSMGLQRVGSKHTHTHTHVA